MAAWAFSILPFPSSTPIDAEASSLRREKEVPV